MSCSFDSARTPETGSTVHQRKVPKCFVTTVVDMFFGTETIFLLNVVWVQFIVVVTGR